MTASIREIRVLVADDEAPARAKIRRLLADEDDARIVGEAEDGADAVRLIRELAPDLVLLDIQMPTTDGFGVVAAVGAGAMPEVIFITAHDEHAVRAFEVHALDFMRKPVAGGRFRAAFARARARLGERQAGSLDLASRLAALLAERASKPEYLARLLVQGDRAAVFVPTTRIDRIEAERNYVRVYAGGARYTVRGTLTGVAERLDPALFLRVSRSTLVRLDAVRAVHPWSHGDYHVELTDGTTVTWSRRYHAQARARFALE
jgi:two-component system LytT family response regulator